MTHKLFDEIGPALRRPQRRLHPHPQARPAPGRQRPHGADRAGLTARRLPAAPVVTLFDDDRGTSGPQRAAGARPDDRRLRRVGVPRLRPATRACATVGGTLRDALAQVLRPPVELTCAGRTDTGVHAWGQVVSFDAPAERFDPLMLQRSVNRLCGPAIVVRDVAVAPEGFDARRSATGRTYRYTVSTARCPTRSSAHRRGTSTSRSTSTCCAWGATRWSASTTSRRSAAGPSAATAARRRWSATCAVRAGPTSATAVLRFEIEANAFCHQMIRSVVGTLVDVGLARKHAGELLGILAGPRPRRALGAGAAPGPVPVGGRLPGRRARMTGVVCGRPGRRGRRGGRVTRSRLKRRRAKTVPPPPRMPPRRTPRRAPAPPTTSSGRWAPS